MTVRLNDEESAAVAVVGWSLAAVRDAVDDAADFPDYDAEPFFGVVLLSL